VLLRSPARCTVWLTHPPISCRYANSGSLFSHVQRSVRLPEAEARWYFQQIVLAVDYCHRKEIANRDIKLENTLLHREDGQVGWGEAGCRVGGCVLGHRCSWAWCRALQLCSGLGAARCDGLHIQPDEVAQLGVI
jgi:serine/threonine protein kinase